MYGSGSPSPGPSAGASAEGLAAARMMQLHLLSRERLSRCDHFVHMLTGQPVCRSCRYAIETLPARPVMRSMTTTTEEKTASLQPYPQQLASPSESLSHTQRFLASLFAPDQTALRFASNRRQVRLDEEMQRGGSTAGNSADNLTLQERQRPALAATGVPNRDAHGSGFSPSSRPHSAMPLPSPGASPVPLRSHVVGARVMPSREDVRSTTDLLQLRLDRHTGSVAAAPDSLALLKRLRDVLGFHQPQPRPASSTTSAAATQRQHAAKTRPASAMPIHDTPNPVSTSGQVARAGVGVGLGGRT